MPVLPDADGLASREGIAVVLFDLDGVVRTFPNAANWPRVQAAAFEPELLERVVTGRISDAQWRTEIARSLGAGAQAEVDAWSESCGEVNAGVMQLVRVARRRARVALFTNATSRLDADIARLGIVGEFDAIFNSSVLGVAKPDPAAFRLVCNELGADPSAVFFVDDSARNVAGALEAGLRATQYVDPASLADDLRALRLID